MDSMTQLCLGAAVSEAIVGSKVGRKATFWGAWLGTLPDLDVLIPMGNPVADFYYHRSFSHSILVLALLTPVWTWIITKSHVGDREHKWRWGWAVFAVFMTHILLDCLTVYGTKVFWPFSNYSVSIGSIFIIDPLYTLPLFTSLLVLYRYGDSPKAHRFNLNCLGISTVYLMWSLVVQNHIQSFAYQSLQIQELRQDRILVTPTPFNTLLWRIVAIGKDHYKVGYASIFDSNKAIQFKDIESQYRMKPKFERSVNFQQLIDQSHGLYSIDKKDNQWLVTDIRMGIEPFYVFQFAIAEETESGLKFIDPVRYRQRPDLSAIPDLFRRIWDENGDSPLTVPN